jgi:hypothetical protein
VGTATTAATVGKRITNEWEQVTFSQAFAAAPVVLSQVQTENDAHWVKTRQRNNSAAGFQVALEEDEAQTTAHGTETIGWLAMEAGQGAWNGHAYQAGKTGDAVRHNWYTITFGQDFGQAPRIVASLASYDGRNALAGGAPDSRRPYPGGTRRQQTWKASARLACWMPIPV